MAHVGLPPGSRQQHTYVGIGYLSKVLITGGAGFIGSNLADHLISLGHEVSVFDNFSTGNRDFVSSRVNIITGDLLFDSSILEQSLQGVECVYHFAANADVRNGWNHPNKDLEQNVVATCKILEAATRNNVKEFIFSSTGSVYGEAEVFPTPEDAPFPVQTSLYGASKASAEAFIQAYSESGKIKGTVFRFVSVLGARYTHGHVIDFVRQLLSHPESLQVLGNGHQRKSYMNVADCVAGVSSLRSEKSYGVFNLGVNDFCEVRDSIRWICDEMGLDPVVTFSGGTRGWIGDNPFIWLDVSRAKSYGWEAGSSIEFSVRETVRWLLRHPEVVTG